ncbi:MAG TPA: phosphatase PAP2 family protein [Longimicrobium sp.]|nr:phosphatase PAP2 family protein [Longimicrobium sp.]
MTERALALPAAPRDGTQPDPGIAVARLLAAGVRRALLEHAPLAVLVGAYVAAGLVAWRLLGIGMMSPERGNELTVTLYDAALTGGGLLLLAQMVRWALRERARGGLRSPATWEAMEAGPVSVQRTVAAAAALLLYGVFFEWFVAFKRSIPLVHAFSLDRALADADRWLHGGHDPWALLQPLLGHPRLTEAVQVAYTAGWFGLIFVGTVLMAWHPDRRLRARFFLATIGCWVVLGTVMAALLSSAGPCYYELVTGDARFRPMVEYLAGVDAGVGFSAAEVQRILWSDFATGDPGGYGVSAMPSLHVAIAVLFALAGWRVHRALGAALWAYAALVLVGSVHLGWHYALDGYAAVAGAVAVWWAAGRVVEWYGRRTGVFGGAPAPAES